MTLRILHQSSSQANFYSVDPKAIPSRASFQTGLALADSLLARHLADEGSTRAAWA